MNGPDTESAETPADDPRDTTDDDPAPDDPLAALLNGAPRRLALEECRETLGRERADAMLRARLRAAVMTLHDEHVVGRQETHRAAVHDALGVDSESE